MRPRERRDSGQNDLFKARLDQIVDTDHALAKLGRAIDWRFLEKRFGAVYSDKTGHPPLPTRLMAGLSILKHTRLSSPMPHRQPVLQAGSPIRSCSAAGCASSASISADVLRFGVAPILRTMSPGRASPARGPGRRSGRAAP